MLFGIYHPPIESYPLLKSIGFTHVEVSINSYPGNQDAIKKCVLEAHKNRLKVILDCGWMENKERAVKILFESGIDSDDIIYLPDEPNLRGIGPKQILELRSIINEFKPMNRTILILSWIRPFYKYANCADMVGVDYYRPYSDLWSLAKFTYEFLKLKNKHWGTICGVAAIKYNSNHIKFQYYYWTRILKVHNLYWYSFTPNEENPPWFRSNLNNLEDIQKVFKQLQD